MGTLLFAAKLREIREKKSLTRADLAAKIGTAYNTIATWEMGIREPGAVMLGKLYAALEIKCPETDELMGHLVKPDPEGFELPKPVEYRSRPRKRPQKRDRQQDSQNKSG